MHMGPVLVLNTKVTVLFYGGIFYIWVLRVHLGSVRAAYFEEIISLYLLSSVKRDWQTCLLHEALKLAPIKFLSGLQSELIQLAEPKLRVNIKVLVLDTHTRNLVSPVINGQIYLVHHFVPDSLVGQLIHQPVIMGSIVPACLVKGYDLRPLMASEAVLLDGKELSFFRWLNYGGRFYLWQQTKLFRRWSKRSLGVRSQSQPFSSLP